MATKQFDKRGGYLGKRAIFSSLSLDLQRVEREFSRMSDVKTVTIGGHEGFGRHLLSNLLSWGRDERRKTWTKKKEEGEGWNGEELEHRTGNRWRWEAISYIYTYTFILYIYTRVTWIHYVEGDVHILGQHFHSIGFTRFFPRFPRFFAMPRLFRERILGCPYKFLVCGSWKRPKISAAHVVTRKTLLNRHHGCG